MNERTTFYELTIGEWFLFNDNLSADDFNELFVESWIKYYGNAQARIFMFRMRGNSWKNDFKGVLLDD